MYDHIGKRIRVKGTSYQRAGNRGLLVEKIEALAQVPFDGVRSHGTTRLKDGRKS
jgi:hypothetical protein